MEQNATVEGPRIPMTNIIATPPGSPGAAPVGDTGAEIITSTAALKARGVDPDARIKEEFGSLGKPALDGLAARAIVNSLAFPDIGDGSDLQPELYQFRYPKPTIWVMPARPPIPRPDGSELPGFPGICINAGIGANPPFHYWTPNLEAEQERWFLFLMERSGKPDEAAEQARRAAAWSIRCIKNYLANGEAAKRYGAVRTQEVAKKHQAEVLQETKKIAVEAGVDASAIDNIIAEIAAKQSGQPHIRRGMGTPAEQDRLMAQEAHAETADLKRRLAELEASLAESRRAQPTPAVPPAEARKIEAARGTNKLRAPADPMKEQHDGGPDAR